MHPAERRALGVWFMLSACYRGLYIQDATNRRCADMVSFGDRRFIPFGGHQLSSCQRPLEVCERYWELVVYVEWSLSAVATETAGMCWRKSVRSTWFRPRLTDPLAACVLRCFNSDKTFLFSLYVENRHGELIPFSSKRRLHPDDRMPPGDQHQHQAIWVALGEHHYQKHCQQKYYSPISG